MGWASETLYNELANCGIYPINETGYSSNCNYYDDYDENRYSENEDIKESADNESEYVCCLY